MMTKLVYRVDLHVPPHGMCRAVVREYPEYDLIGGDLTALMKRVQTELPEFLYLKSCNKRSYVPPRKINRQENSVPGVLFYYCEINAHEIKGGVTRHELRMSKSQWDVIDHVVQNHGHFESATHFLTWAALRAADQLTNTFWKDINATLDTIMDCRSDPSILSDNVVRVTDALLTAQSDME